MNSMSLQHSYMNSMSFSQSAMSDDEGEYAPLTSVNDGRNNQTIGYDSSVVIKDDGRGCNSGQEEKDDDDETYPNYTQPRRFGFKTARYSGYNTVGRWATHDSWGRVSMHDSCDGQDDESKASVDGDEDDENGDFVSFWRDRDDDSSCSGSERKINPQHEEHLESSANDDDDDDDRVETTMRPIPLLYRKQTGLGWFQREPGLSNMHFNDNDGVQSRRMNRSWGLWRRDNSGASDFDDFEDFDNSEDEGDTNSLLASSSVDDVGHHMPNLIPSRAQSPSHYSRPAKEEARASNDNIFRRENRRGEGMLSLRIIRPFLRGSRRGFTDNTDTHTTNEIQDDDNIIDDYAGDAPSRQDRAAVVKSISRGIVGTNDDSLLLDSTCGDVDKRSTTKHPPNLLGRIFSSRFLRSPDDRNNQTSVIQLHGHLRKEDWSLAVNLVQSNPELARTWHRVDRLYGGKYGGEALPIHAACALCPPSSFIEMLATLYPEGLVKKDTAFGRVPLTVACRSLAKSSVIRVLCEMDPKCVEERDTLKRVPLHYLIKNYRTFGDDSDDSSIDDNTVDTESNDGEENSEDGMHALKKIIKTNPDCVRAADHRGWLPIHVACSCSSRKGMIRVMRLLLKVWPESINFKTDKDTDAFACVDMAGKHHPTKDRVISLLKEAKSKVDRIKQPGDENSEGCDELTVENGDDIDEDKVQSLSENSAEEDKSASSQSLITPEEHS